MNADELKAILDMSLAQMMGKIGTHFNKLDAKVAKKASKEDIDRPINTVDSICKAT